MVKLLLLVDVDVFLALTNCRAALPLVDVATGVQVFFEERAQVFVLGAFYFGDDCLRGLTKHVLARVVLQQFVCLAEPLVKLIAILPALHHEPFLLGSLGSGWSNHYGFAFRFR